MPLEALYIEKNSYGVPASPEQICRHENILKSSGWDLLKRLTGH
jgi:hypothetical protein